MKYWWFVSLALMLIAIPLPMKPSMICLGAAIAINIVIIMKSSIERAVWQGVHDALKKGLDRGN